MPLCDFVEANKLGEVVLGPLDTYLDDENIFQPDLLFISNERLSIIQKYIYGAPDLVVEILLPVSEKLDSIEKKAVYEKCGVREYWLVDPETKEVFGYSLRNNAFVEIPSRPGDIASPLLNTTFRF